MKNIDLSIVIVSFNTKDLLVECIDSIQDTVKKSKFELIIVDNASTDGTQDVLNQISKKLNNITVIHNKENTGFSKANNQGIKKSSGKYLLFLNPDMVMYDKAIDGMTDYMNKHEDVGASTCFIELPDGTLDDAAHRAFPTPWNALCHFTKLSKIFSKTKMFGGYNLGYLDLKTTHEIDALAGAFMFTRREAGEQVGWWDEDYFWYGEDIDFCYRLKQSGWKIMYVPDFKVLHYKGASGGIKKTTKHVTKATKETKAKAQKARFNAMRIFYKKHYNEEHNKLLSWLVIKGISIVEIVKSKI